MSSVASTRAGVPAPYQNPILEAEYRVQEKLMITLGYHKGFDQALRDKILTIGEVGGASSTNSNQTSSKTKSELEVLEERLRLNSYVKNKLLEFGQSQKWHTTNTLFKPFELDLKPYDDYVKTHNVGNSKIANGDLVQDLITVRKDYKELFTRIEKYNSFIAMASALKEVGFIPASTKTQEEKEAKEAETEGEKFKSYLKQFTDSSMNSETIKPFLDTPAEKNHLSNTNSTSLGNTSKTLNEEIEELTKQIDKTSSFIQYPQLSVLAGLLILKETIKVESSIYYIYVYNLFKNIQDENTEIWKPFFELCKRVLEKIRHSNAIDSNDLKMIQEYQTKRNLFVAQVIAPKDEELPYVYTAGSPPPNGYITRRVVNEIDLMKNDLSSYINHKDGQASAGKPLSEKKGLFETIKQKWIAENFGILKNEGKNHLYGASAPFEEYISVCRVVTSPIVKLAKNQESGSTGEPEEKIAFQIILEKTLYKIKDELPSYLLWFREIRLVSEFRERCNREMLKIQADFLRINNKIQPIQGFDLSTPLDTVTKELSVGNIVYSNDVIQDVVDAIAAVRKLHQKARTDLDTFKPYSDPFMQTLNANYTGIWKLFLNQSEEALRNIVTSSYNSWNQNAFDQLSDYKNSYFALENDKPANESVADSFILSDETPPPDGHIVEKVVGQVNLKGRGIPVFFADERAVLGALVETKGKGKNSTPLETVDLLKNLATEWDDKNGGVGKQKNKIKVFGLNPPFSVYEVEHLIGGDPVIQLDGDKTDNLNGSERLREDQLLNFTLRIILITNYERREDLDKEAYSYLHCVKIAEVYKEKHYAFINKTMTHFKKIEAYVKKIQAIEEID